MNTLETLDEDFRVLFRRLDRQSRLVGWACFALGLLVGSVGVGLAWFAFG